MRSYIAKTSHSCVKDLVCCFCWHNIFKTEQFQLLCLCRCSDGRCPNGIKTKTTVQIVEKSASQGCNWCSFLHTFTSRKDGYFHPEDILHISLCDFYTNYSTPRGKNTYYLNIKVESSHGTQALGWSLRLHAFSEPREPAAFYVRARKLQTEVFSNSATQQIYDWLADCAAHQQCPKQTEKALPTRVIEVSPASASGRPRLRITAGKQGRYAALSYCWGNNGYQGLNSSNLDAYIDQLDFGVLPQTIHDAIAVTKAVGIPYLWIDSICILQDSIGDKQNEMLVMDRVYRDSLITLVAASSDSATKGFLHPRQRHCKSYTLPFCIPKGKFGTVSIGDLDDLEYDESSEPVNARAWCLQEGLLAHRYLIYSSHTLQWRCNSRVRNLGESLHLVSYSDDSRYTQSLYTLSKPCSDSETELKRWIRLVELYADRLSSLPHDKLNAISAVAITFASKLGPAYYAGLWQSSLLWQLTWVTACSWNSDARNTRPKVYRAPSWSWASVDGGLFYDTVLLEEDNEQTLYRCDLLSCETSSRSPDLPFGEVLAGSLKLQGVLRQAWLKPTSKDLLWLAEDDGSLAAAESVQDTQRQAEQPWDKDWSPTARGYHDEAGEWPPILVFCLPVSSGEETIARGLLLIAAKDDMLRRIGSFEGVNRRDFDQYPQCEIIII